MARATERPSDWLSRALGGWDNPFLQRSWYRALRQGSGPLTGPMVLCAACVLLFGVAILLSYLLGRHDIRETLDLNSVLPLSTLCGLSRWAAVCAIGLTAWVCLVTAYSQASSATWQEEKQRTMELLFATPLPRWRMAWLLPGWPFLAAALNLLPTLPVLLVLMPVVGLGATAAFGLVTVILAGSLLVSFQAPSGNASEEGPTERRRSELGCLVLLLLLAPLLAWALADGLGLPGLGLLSWPVGLVRLLGQQRPVYSHPSALWPWVLGLWLLGLTAQYLGSWRRLSRGSEVRPPPTTLAGTPLLLVTVYLLGGLAWPQLPTGRGGVLLTALLLLAGMSAMSACRGSTESLWFLLWWPGERTERPLVRAALRVLDRVLFVLLVLPVWWLGAGRTGAAWPAWTSAACWQVTGIACLGAALAEHAHNRQARLRRAGEFDAKRSRGMDARAAGLALIWAQGLLGYAASTEQPGVDFCTRLFGLPSWVGSALCGLGLCLALGTAMAERVLREGAKPRSRVMRNSVLWYLLPRAWRENPLTLKARRTTGRHALTGLLPLVMIALTLGGLVLAVCAVVLPQPTAGCGIVWWALYAWAGVLRDWGNGAAGMLFAGLQLAPAPAVLLGAMAQTGLVLSVGLTVMAASLSGRMVTDERLAGSLGFLLMTDLTDREVAVGFIIGHLYPALEVVAWYAVVLLLWAVASLHPAVAIGALLVVLFLAGLVVSTAGLAFLGTARYESRANGTPLALFASGSYQFGLFIALEVVYELCASSTTTEPGWPWAGAWVTLTLLAAFGLWQAAPGGIRRLRRVGRMWRAFEPVSRQD